MAEVTKQMRLDKEALEIRPELLNLNDYQNGADTEYSESHEDAKTHDDTSHPLGKATNNTKTEPVTPNENGSKTMYTAQLDTSDGGGSYDKYGHGAIKSGRSYLSSINIYSENESYGISSPDMTENIKDGQYEIYWKGK